MPTLGSLSERDGSDRTAALEDESRDLEPLDVRLCLVDETDAFEVRRLGLAPAQAKPPPAYPDAKEIVHVGAYCGAQLVSVAAFVVEPFEDMEADPAASGRHWRIRGMATRPEHRRSGFARAVLYHGIRLIRQRAAALLWCNGRTTALGFYLRHGFRRIGEERHLPGVQPHFHCVKILEGGRSAGKARRGEAETNDGAWRSQHGLTRRR